MTETDVYEQVTRHLAKYHPTLIWHWDLAGVNNPSRASRALYSRLNGRRGWEDLTIDEPRFMPETNFPYHGLRIEVKKPGERLKKRDGQWASAHIAEQADQIDRHRSKGYVADFGCGTDEVLELIHSYLGGECSEHHLTPDLYVDNGSKSGFWVEADIRKKGIF